MISELRGVIIAGETYPVAPYLREEDQLPAVVYEVTDDEIIDDLSASGNTLRNSIIDLRCIATTYEGADDLSETVHSKLRAHSFGTGEIQSAHVIGFDRAYDMPIESSNQLLYITTARVQVWWKPA